MARRRVPLRKPTCTSSLRGGGHVFVLLSVYDFGRMIVFSPPCPPPTQSVNGQISSMRWVQVSVNSRVGDLAGNEGLGSKYIGGLKRAKGSRSHSSQVEGLYRCKGAGGGLIPQGAVKVKHRTHMLPECCSPVPLTTRSTRTHLLHPRLLRLTGPPRDPQQRRRRCAVTFTDPDLNEIRADQGKERRKGAH